ncbi:MAG TPA: alpha-glucan family phosphorylase [Steroidobacteraceae bacterium]|nr:alpha-glucan family phosphorylase [Steroidobacteraceae bacterium]
MPDTAPHPLHQRLPQAIAALGPLALNLHWTWNHAADDLWERIDPAIWRRTQNPLFVLQNAPRRRLEALAADPTFLRDLATAARAQQEYLSRADWFAETHGGAAPLRIAYFSMEYGLSDALPIYSGGLGILAGDHLKSASDLGVPLVGVGLLYHEGYFRQMIDSGGAQLELYTHNDAETLPIEAVLDADGAPLRIAIDLPGRALRLRIWRVRVGRTDLFLLDSNDPLNSPADRAITSKLYGGDRETRLVQEIVLGIGGWRMLGALGLEIDVCHLNEGHAAFVTLERARSFAREHQVPFLDSLWATRGGNVFTTHTPVEAAFDTFPLTLLAKYGTEYAQNLGIAPEQLIALGHRTGADPDGPFNMAYLAARTCARLNAVSELHASISRQIFAPLYPRWPEREIPIAHVTNGVHVPSWDSAWADVIWTEACGKGRWLRDPGQLAGTIERLNDEALWSFRADERRDLVEYARERLALQLGHRGGARPEIEAARDWLDPNVLTLGFARRFTEYKRPDLLLTDPERLVRLLTDPRHPVQLIVAGKAHPHDERGKASVRRWVQFAQRPDVRSRLVFIEDYDMALAAQLVQGVDVWINTPRRPWEACGTSGMKVLVNGGLNLSVLDGWWAEAYSGEVGWAIDEVGGRPGAASDAAVAAELYRLLEQEVVPEFYERDGGIPRRWVARMRASMAQLTPRFSSNRMLTEYVDQMYLRAAQDYRLRCLGDGERAHALRHWLHRLRHHWQEIHWGSLDVEPQDEGWAFSVQVYLGSLKPEDVEVQLFADGGPEIPGECHDMSRGAALPGATGGWVYGARLWTHRPATDYTPRIIPARSLANVPAEAHFISWYGTA